MVRSLVWSMAGRWLWPDLTPAEWSGRAWRAEPVGISLGRTHSAVLSVVALGISAGMGLFSAGLAGLYVRLRTEW